MVEHWGHNPSVVGSIPIIVIYINIKMNKISRYKNIIDYINFYNYIKISEKEEKLLAPYIYRYGLFTPLKIKENYKYLNRSQLPLFKYKFVASLVGKYVYVVIKQLKIYSIFFKMVRKLMKREKYKKNTVKSENIRHHTTNEFLYVKYYYHIFIWYKWWFRKKHIKQRRRMWTIFHQVSSGFWGRVIKRRVKFFIFIMLKSIRLKKKLFLKSYDEIARSLYLFILYLKKKRRKKIINRGRSIHRKRSIKDDIKKYVMLSPMSKEIYDRILYKRDKQERLLMNSFDKISNIDNYFILDVYDQNEWNNINLDWMVSFYNNNIEIKKNLFFFIIIIIIIVKKIYIKKIFF